MKLWVALLFAVSFLHCISVKSIACDYVVLTEFNPPFSYTEAGGVSGSCTEVLLEATARADLPLERDEIALWPWARAYKELRESDNVILYPTIRTEEREGLFQWVGPVLEFKCGLMSLKRRNIVITDIVADSKQYKFGSVRDTAPEQAMLARGVALGDLQQVHDLRINIRKLMNGRLDGVLYNEVAFKHTVKSMGLNPDDFEMAYVLFESSVYYAVSKKVSSFWVGKLQNALDELRSSGRMQEIIDRYH